MLYLINAVDVEKLCYIEKNKINICDVGWFCKYKKKRTLHLENK